MRFKRFVSIIALTVLMSIVITQTACPGLTQSQLDKAATSSRTVAKYTGTVILTAETLWRTGVIKDIKVKDQIALKLKEFSISGRDFNGLIISYSKQYGTGGVPTAVWQDIVLHFDELTKIFVDILTMIPKLAGLKDSTAFKLITAAILTLAQLFINVGGISLPQFEKIKKLLPDWKATVRDYSYAFNA